MQKLFGAKGVWCKSCDVKDVCCKEVSGKKGDKGAWCKSCLV